MELDHDRKGVAGSPDLARTILEKIEAAAVIVADVTPVGIVPVAAQDYGNKQPKKLINSNVAIELGYSLRARSDRSLLMVMNAHYGSRSDLPFDIAHKSGPIMFTLAPEADKATLAAEATKLKAEFVRAIRLCIVDQVDEKKAQNVFEPSKPLERQGRFFAPGTILASVGQPGEQNFHFKHDRIAYIRIYPTFATTTITRASLSKIFDEGRPMAMSSSDFGNITSRNEFGPITFRFEGHNFITSLTQGIKNGELWGLTSEIFAKREFKSPQTGIAEPATILPMVTFEKLFVRVLRNYVKVEGALGLSLPYQVVMGLVGLRDVYLTVPVGGPFGNGRVVGPIREDQVERAYTLATDDDGAIKKLLREFFCEIYDLAIITRDEAWTEELLAAHDLPPPNA